MSSEKRDGMSVSIVPTGTANLASVAAGVTRAGGVPCMVEDPRKIAEDAALVLPGVGSFRAAMERLESRGFAEPLRRRIDENRPTLCICVGHQVLVRASEESPGSSGLGAVDAKVERFVPPLRVPQIGWNAVRAARGSRFVVDGYAYFANSYFLRGCPEGWLESEADYGVTFVAAMERGNLLSCQFHPELSGPWGVDVLKRWLKNAAKVFWKEGNVSC